MYVLLIINTRTTGVEKCLPLRQKRQVIEFTDSWSSLSTMSFEDLAITVALYALYGSVA